MLQVREQDRVLYLDVPEPVALGAASTRLAWDLIEVCADVEAREVPPVAVVLVSASGGFWLLSPRLAADCDAVGEVWAHATSAVGRLSPPTVAAIGGDAVGPAWELALACDLRIAAREVLLGSPEIVWGRIPAAGGTQRLARLVGPTAALRLLLMGEVVDAARALELGLVHRLAAPHELAADVEALLAPLRAAAPVALAYVKEAVHYGVELPLDDGLRLEADLAALLQTTADRAEGVRSFLERRAPHFEGR